MLIIFGALKIELKNIIRDLRVQQKMLKKNTVLHTGKFGTGGVIIVVTGIGKENASCAADMASFIS